MSCCCGAAIVILFEDSAWCGTCALFAISDTPARVYFDLLGEPLPLIPGDRVGERRVAA